MFINLSLVISFMTIFSIDVANAASYQPVYATLSHRGYKIVYGVLYDDQQKHYLVNETDESILSLCPREEDPHSLEALETQPSPVVVTPTCDSLAEAVVLKIILAQRFAIGFLVYKPDLFPTHEDSYEGIPKGYHPLPLFYLTMDDSTPSRIKAVTYTIANGEHLQSEPEVETNDLISKYHKNDKLDYDIDSFYSQTSCRFRKIPLAPPDDFLLQPWKSAARSNIQTAPMWNELVPQWTSLQIFTRRVAQVLDELTITTGIHDVLIQSGTIEPVYLADKKYSVSKYFWKMIEYDYDYKNEKYRFGILFVMHNDPKTLNMPILCSKDVSENTGWKFLQGDQRFKSSMYACSINKTILSFFDQTVDHAEQYREFNLHKLPVLFNDGNGGQEIREFDVLDEMNKIQEFRSNSNEEKKL